jgi:hypothetical protein
MKFSTTIFLISMFLFAYIQSSKIKTAVDAKTAGAPHKLMKGDEFYHIVSKKSGKCMDVYGGRGAHANVIQWACHGGDNQKWKILYTHENTSIISAVHSGFVLDVHFASKKNAANIITWHLHAGKNQQWLLEPDHEGYYTLRGVWSGQVLDVHSGSTKNGASVIQYPRHGGANQLWELRPTHV